MQKPKRIVRYSLEQIREMIARGEDGTDFAAVARKTEAELESDVASDPDADIGEPSQTWVLVPPGYDVRLVKKRA